MVIPPGGGAGGDGAFGALPSPLDAVDDLRSAARWTLAAAGAVGVALISGGPLVAAGQVRGIAHVVVAGAGLLLALGGVGLAIWSTSKVLAPRLTTTATVMSPELAGLRKTIEASSAQVFGVLATSVPDLLKHQEIAVGLARQVAAEADPARRQLMEAQLRRVEGNAARAAPYVGWLVGLAHVWLMNEDLRRSRRFTLGGAALVVVGAVLFFSVAGGGPA